MTRIGNIPSIVDGFEAIIEYVEKYPNLAVQLCSFLQDYIVLYWLQTMGLSAITVFDKDIRTNNYVESYHAAIINCNLYTIILYILLL